MKHTIIVALMIAIAGIGCSGDTLDMELKINELATIDIEVRDGQNYIIIKKRDLSHKNNEMLSIFYSTGGAVFADDKEYRGAWCIQPDGDRALLIGNVANDCWVGVRHVQWLSVAERWDIQSELQHIVFDEEFE